MKKNTFFFTIFSVFLFFVSNFYSVAQQKGIEECENLLYFLQINNYNAQKIPILENNSSSFPFNIKIDFFPQEESETSEKAFSNANGFETLVFLFSIEELQSDFSFLLETLDSIKNFSRKGKIEFIFTYGSESALKNDGVISGTETFLNTITEENYAVICVSLLKKQNAIISGGGGDLTPSWLINLVSGSFHENGLKYHLRGGILNSLYRLNLLKSDWQTSMFLKNGIPSCAVYIAGPNKNQSYNKKLSNFIAICAYNFEPENTLEWDRHSRAFSFFNNTFLFSERFTIVLFIIISAVCLFFLCGFYFIRLLQRKSYSRKILKKWPLIFLCVILTVISFLIGQGFSYILLNLFNLNVITGYSAKIIISFLLISVSYFLFAKFTDFHSTKLFYFLMNITGILNIFIFTVLDLSLFYLFACEYLIIALTKKIKTLPGLTLSFILLAVPYFPYVFEFVTCLTESALRKILFASFPLNAAFSFAFIPFELIWFKILENLNIRWNKYSTQKKIFIKQNIITISVAFGIFLIIFTTFDIIVSTKYKALTTQTVKTDKLLASESIKISYKDEVFFGETTRTIFIELSEENENVCVKIKGKAENPILYSSEDYEYDAAEKTVVFKLTTWPPKKMSFTYIPNIQQESEVIVSYSLWSEDKKSEKTITFFENSIKIPSTKTKSIPKGIKSEL